MTYNTLQLLRILLLKLSDLFNKSSFRLVSASIWHVPIIHPICPCFMVQCSGPGLLVFSLPHIWGIFMDPFKWRMAVSYQNLSFNVFIAIGCPCSLTPWIELENICMLHIHLGLYLFLFFLSICLCTVGIYNLSKTMISHQHFQFPSNTIGFILVFIFVTLFFWQ